MINITKKGNKAWVTFSIKPTMDGDVFLCGEWNNWEEEKMKMKKNGEYYIRRTLDCDKSYQFGYKVGSDVWLCDSEVESIVSPFGSQNNQINIRS